MFFAHFYRCSKYMRIKSKSKRFTRHTYYIIFQRSTLRVIIMQAAIFYCIFSRVALGAFCVSEKFI